MRKSIDGLCAIVLNQLKTELELISRILGHSSTETTRIYATLSVEMMRKAMETGKLAADKKHSGRMMKPKWQGFAD